MAEVYFKSIINPAWGTFHIQSVLGKRLRHKTSSPTTSEVTTDALLPSHPPTDTALASEVSSPHGDCPSTDSSEYFAPLTPVSTRGTRNNGTPHIFTAIGVSGITSSTPSVRDLNLADSGVPLTYVLAKQGPHPAQWLYEESNEIGRLIQISSSIKPILSAQQPADRQSDTTHNHRSRSRLTRSLWRHSSGSAWYHRR